MYYDRIVWPDDDNDILYVYFGDNLLEEIDLYNLGYTMANEMDIDYDHSLLDGVVLILYSESGGVIDRLQLDVYLKEDYLPDMGYQFRNPNPTIPSSTPAFLLHADLTITPMSKSDTKEAELNTAPIVNPIFQATHKGNTVDKDMLRKYSILLSWHGRLDKVNEITKNKELSKLLGFKPLYFVTYEYRNAVWGFEFEDKPVVLYNSKKGLSIQVSPDVDVYYVGRLIDFLYGLLVHPDTEKDIMELIGTLEEQYNAYPPYVPYSDESGEYDVYMSYAARDDEKYEDQVNDLIGESYKRQVLDEKVLKGRMKDSLEDADNYDFGDTRYHDAVDECVAEYDYDTMVGYLQKYGVSNVSSSFYDCFDTETGEFRMPDKETVDDYVWRYIGTLIDEDAWGVYNDKLSEKDLPFIYNTSDVWMNMCEDLDFNEIEHIPRSAPEFVLHSPLVRLAVDTNEQSIVDAIKRIISEMVKYRIANPKFIEDDYQSGFETGLDEIRGLMQGHHNIEDIIEVPFKSDKTGLELYREQAESAKDFVIDQYNIEDEYWRGKVAGIDKSIDIINAHNLKIPTHAKEFRLSADEPQNYRIVEPEIDDPDVAITKDFDSLDEVAEYLRTKDVECIMPGTFRGISGQEYYVLGRGEEDLGRHMFVELVDYEVSNLDSLMSTQIPTYAKEFKLSASSTLAQLKNDDISLAKDGRQGFLDTVFYWMHKGHAVKIDSSGEWDIPKYLVEKDDRYYWIDDYIEGMGGGESRAVIDSGDRGHVEEWLDWHIERAEEFRGDYYSPNEEQPDIEQLVIARWVEFDWDDIIDEYEEKRNKVPTFSKSFKLSAPSDKYRMEF